MLTTSPRRPPVLIASDIDGTLLETGRPSSVSVIEAVAAVLDAGHELVLSTGRSLSGALVAARELIDDSLVGWANRAELKPRRARTGADASAAGRAQLEAAGYTHEAD